MNTMEELDEISTKIQQKEIKVVDLHKMEDSFRSEIKEFKTQMMEKENNLTLKSNERTKLIGEIKLLKIESAKFLQKAREERKKNEIDVDYSEL